MEAVEVNANMNTSTPLTADELRRGFEEVVHETGLDLGITKMYAAAIGEYYHDVQWEPQARTACGIDLTVTLHIDEHFDVETVLDQACPECVWQEYYLLVGDKSTYVSIEKMLEHRRSIMGAIAAGEITTLAELDRLCQALGQRQVRDLSTDDALTSRAVDLLKSALDSEVGRAWEESLGSSGAEGVQYLVDVELESRGPTAEEENAAIILDILLDRGKAGKYLSLVSAGVLQHVKKSKVFNLYDELEIREETDPAILETVVVLYDPSVPGGGPMDLLEDAWEAALRVQ